MYVFRVITKNILIGFDGLSILLPTQVRTIPFKLDDPIFCCVNKMKSRKNPK